MIRDVQRRNESFDGNVSLQSASELQISERTQTAGAVWMAKSAGSV